MSIKIEGIAEPDLLPKGLDFELVTDYILPDEKAYWLVESTYSYPSYKGKKRFQLIWVNREDRLAAWVGVVDDDQGVDYPEFRIPSLWEHSVDEMQYMAQQLRFDDTLDNLMKEQAENSTLIKDFMELAERRQAIKANRSTFGAGKTTGTQRIGFHPS